LRTPLNAILGWSQIITRDQLESSDAKLGLQAIERNTRAQAQMFEDLLDMIRIGAGKIRLDVRRMVLGDIVAGAIQSARPSAEVKGVRLITVIDPNSGPIAGDAGRLQQVIWNLLTNAIKFTPRGGLVKILAWSGASVELIAVLFCYPVVLRPLAIALMQTRRSTNRRSAVCWSSADKASRQSRKSVTCWVCKAKSASARI
jgi:signal transduction histidine kinase